ncbi:heterokaryon incompatibility protein-domain-containing protein [Alternaria rosae]|uniref:heterokaryon incompatibility protein-domain-containing protein n=1 Tax=Alternaria rosae TaxID=1187941 RepID=UPI001E8E849E|nr:heterokaryon incompatibility protein-domain-containing protein [Alternaria rosae]KAH6870843.1 heterokaryon incompatibility protein-domain-containing protein [Alternaria rosae]
MDGHSQIQVQLWEDTEGAAYKCLSYTWEDQSETYPIWVNYQEMPYPTSVNYQEMQVGKNLYDFLEVASHISNDYFWIDALCINQSDDVEKSLQVQRMGDIYKNAKEVCVWLGNGKENRIPHLFWQMERAIAASNSSRYEKRKGLVGVGPTGWRRYGEAWFPVDTASPVSSNDGCFKNRNDLFDICTTDLANHPYWNRAWTVQELLSVRSPQRIFLCSRAETRALEELLHYCQDDPRLRRIETLLKGTYFRHGSAIPFWFIFYQLGRTLECRDPRDRIYSLLSVTGQERFTVDYSESTVGLFFRTATHFSAWGCPYLLTLLWYALGVTRESVEDAFKFSLGYQVSIPMRATNYARGLNLRKRCRPRGGSPHWRAQIKGCTSRDILLCPSTNVGVPRRIGEEIFDQENIHVVIRRGSKNAISLSLHTHSFGVLPYSKQMELWFDKDGIESRITNWKDALRYAGLCRSDIGFNDDENKDDGIMDSWKLNPHFTLKMTHEYPIACVAFMESQGKEAIKKSLQNLETGLRKYGDDSIRGLLSATADFGTTS